MTRIPNFSNTERIAERCLKSASFFDSGAFCSPMIEASSKRIEAITGSRKR